MHSIRLIILSRNLPQTRALSSGRLTSSYLSAQNILDAKRKLILAEYALLKHQNPVMMPRQLSESQLNYLSSLFDTHLSEKKKLRAMVDFSYKLRKRALLNMRRLEDFECFKAGQNSLLLPFSGSENERLRRRQIGSFTNFYPNLIVDISFDSEMSSLECKNLAEQLIHMFNLNKSLDFLKKKNSDSLKNYNSNIEQFNLHLTNLGSSHLTRNFLHALIGPHFDAYPNVFLHEHSLIDVFKERKLIYLSPHAEETLTEYDHEAFYIIGGIVDRREIIELTPTRCNQLGIPLVKLPLDPTFNQQVHSLYTVYKIMYKLKYNSDSSSLLSLSNKQVPHSKRL